MLATYTLQLIISGLCAFVPTNDGVSVILLDAMKNTSGQPCKGAMVHYPRLSTSLAFVQGPPDAVGQYSKVSDDGNGREDISFDLSGLMVTLDPIMPQTPFSKRSAFLKSTELPQWFIPEHSEDFRWVVDASQLVPGPKVKADVLYPNYKGVAAFAKISQGELRTSSLLRDHATGNYLDWKFDPNGLPKPHIQALADQVTIELEFQYDPDTAASGAPVVFRFNTLDGKALMPLALTPTPGSRIMRVSITNLPNELMLTTSGPVHFNCYCDLVQDAGTKCGVPIGYGSFSTAGVGIMCPMISLQQP